MRSTLFAFLALFVSSCATFGTHSHDIAHCDENAETALQAGRVVDPALCLTTDAEGVPTEESDYQRFFKAEAPNGAKAERPLLGLALSGGGTKAASAAMGVLAGLERSGLLKQVDVISTVSGGGYAAYYYFRSLMDIAADSPKNMISDADVMTRFKDCLPRFFSHSKVRVASDVEDPYCSSDASKESPDFAIEKIGVSEGYRTNLNRLGKYYKANGQYAHQMAIRYQQDIVAESFDFPDKSKFGFYTSWTREAAEFSMIGGGTAAVWPLDLVTNQIFDWNTQVSASAANYKWGIYHTYGAANFDCGRSILRRNRHSATCNEDYQKNNSVARLKSLTESTRANCPLMAAPSRTDCRRIPLWIINATSGYSDTPFYHLENDAADMVRDVFEITPFGFGSGNYGYFSGLPPFDLLTAVLASASFADSQQKAIGQPIRGVIGGTLDTIGVNWGVDIQNPRVSTGEAAFHRLLPVPFYMAHGTIGNEYSIDIHLSDGGNAENLGAYALLRRGVKNIIIADTAEDQHGQMDDLCHLARELDWTQFSEDTLDDAAVPNSANASKSRLRREFKIVLLFPELADLGRHCKDLQTSNYNYGYPIHHWPSPVLRGCAFKLPVGQKSAADWDKLFSEIEQDIYDDSESRMAWESNDYCNAFLTNSKWQQELSTGRAEFWSNLYLLKPALDEDWVCEEKDEFRQQISDLRANKEVVLCRSKLDAEVLSFLMINSEPLNKDPTKIWKSRECPRFPQDSTVTLTADSEAAQYGAYKALMAAYASLLTRNSAGKIDLDRSRFGGTDVFNKLKTSYHGDSRTNQNSPHRCKVL